MMQSERFSINAQSQVFSQRATNPDPPRTNQNLYPAVTEGRNEESGNPWISERGSMMILTVVVLFCLMMLSCCLLEFTRLITLVDTVQNAFDNSMLAVVSANSESAYGGSREGYSGAYDSVAGSWRSSEVDGDLRMSMQQTLNLNESGEILERIESGLVVYRLDDITYSVSNADFAGSSASESLSAEGTLQMAVPLHLGNLCFPSVIVTIRTNASFRPIF